MVWNDLNGLIEPVVFERSLPEERVVSLSEKQWPGTWRGRQRIAILVHGVACTWTFMRGLGFDLERLEGRSGPFYAQVAHLAHDWRRSIDENAERLVTLLGQLSGRAAIDLYGYSQGGLLVRRAAEMAGPRAKALGIRHVFTFNAPHGGSPLAHVHGSRLMRWSAGLLGQLAVWQCDGIRDLAPGSPFLSSLGKPPEGVAYTFFAGNSGWSFLRGVTQPLFGAEANDGVASVPSQLHTAADWAGVATSVKSRIARLVYPIHHFSLARGVSLGAASGDSLLESIAGRIALAM